MTPPKLAWTISVGALSFIILRFLVVPAAGAELSSGQGGQSSVATMQALLDEVHQLRVAVEQAVLVNSRMQLMLLRLDVQQERVSDLVGQMRSVRSELADVMAQIERTTGNVNAVRSRLRQATEPDLRQQLGVERVYYERQLATHTTAERQLRMQEIEVGTALQAAQARLTELNSRLDQIDQLLSDLAPPR